MKVQLTVVMSVSQRDYKLVELMDDEKVEWRDKTKVLSMDKMLVDKLDLCLVGQTVDWMADRMVGCSVEMMVA